MRTPSAGDASSSETTGAIRKLNYKATSQDWAAPDHPLALFTYQTLSQTDYAAFFRNYVISDEDWAKKDFGKPNIERYGAVSKIWTPTLAQCEIEHTHGLEIIRTRLEFSRDHLDKNDLVVRLSAPRGKQSFSNWLRKAAQLSPVGIGLLQEAAVVSGTPLPLLSPAALAGLINAVPLKLDGVAPIARAISTAGGISFDELDAGFMIRRLPGVFAAGEMLDWEAPTGGYLLQASFATGAAAWRGVLKYLDPHGEERSKAARLEP